MVEEYAKKRESSFYGGRMGEKFTDQHMGKSRQKSAHNETKSNSSKKK